MFCDGAVQRYDIRSEDVRRSCDEEKKTEQKKRAAVGGLLPDRDSLCGDHFLRISDDPGTTGA